MKNTSARYLIGMGFKNIWVNKLMSVASVGTLVACMLMIGVIAMVSVNVTNAFKSIEEQNVIMAYLNDRNSVIYGSADPLTETTEEDDAIPEDAYLIHNEEEARAVEAKIAALDNVKETFYISKEDNLKAIQEKYLSGRDECIEVLEEDDGNPLSDSVRIVVKDMARYNETADAVRKIEGVTSIQAQGEIADKINAISGAIKTAGIWIVAVMLLISFVIVSNTIRVAMYSRKLEISIMKAVGATSLFIRLPFVVEGVTIGVISAAVAFVMMYLMQNAVVQALTKALSLSMTMIVPFKTYAFTLLGIFVALGVLFGAVGSALVLGKYLKKEGSEFRAY